MARFDTRLESLEALLGASPPNPMALPMDPEYLAILDEYSAMGAIMSDTSYRGSPNGLVKIKPRDVAREWYGREYTEREFLELAVLRALEGLDYPDEKIDERLPVLVETFIEAFTELGLAAD